MSTTSSKTASSRDHDVPSGKVDFKNKMCPVLLTRGDGTLMDASCVTEEDIIEICIKMGHIHPLGVLHYSTTELVVLFHLTDELQHITCRIVKATELQGEAITVMAMAPKAHTKVYLVTLHLNPPNREGELHTPPEQTPLSRGMPHCLQAEHGDLANHKLHQLMEDLRQEISLCKVNMLPSIPLQIHGYVHQGVGTLRRMTRGSPFREGEGQVHRGNPLHLQNLSDQLEDGLPLDHHNKHHILLYLVQMWDNWSPPWHLVCTWALWKSILLVVTLPLVKQRYHLNSGTMRFSA